ncbi:pentapeptide repeat-containing protein [Streptomyces griseocarneus]|uniref:pentapeptide repeat-containing protein n=1 Tax=Streptomyces griseocarneus TaxID=51201 RepID=UPI00167CA56D|nr:pentapeptide repeat-containing protein [Streptomyces griseocarneus]MBZ6475450.1 pentapeptide repeat-containing protein [Streptomyces griseocarneus]GHG75348.1 hypothetical protein GCM10018779_52890 [Streptomyces griseocarneus]
MPEETCDGERRISKLPADEEAARWLAEWESAEDGRTVDATFLDLRGADLTRVDFSCGLLCEADLRGVALSGACFHRAHLEGADFARADLSGACLSKAILDEASLLGTNAQDANLGSSELHEVDATGANLRGARLNGASLHGVRLQGADLSGATVNETSFRVFMDHETVVEGLTGTLFGPATVADRDGDGGDGPRRLGGPELERWLNGRGARVQVLRPYRERTTTVRPPQKGAEE